MTAGPVLDEVGCPYAAISVSARPDLATTTVLNCDSRALWSIDAFRISRNSPRLDASTGGSLSACDRLARLTKTLAAHRNSDDASPNVRAFAAPAVCVKASGTLRDCVTKAWIGPETKSGDLLGSSYGQTECRDKAALWETNHPVRIFRGKFFARHGANITATELARPTPVRWNFAMVAAAGISRNTFGPKP